MMQKIALINLEGKYSLYAIMETQTYEPVFLKWSPDLLDTLTEYGCVILYTTDVTTELVRTIREHLHFLNISLIIYTDSLDIEKKRELLQAGADVVGIIPDGEGEFLYTIKCMHDITNPVKTLRKDILTPFRQSIEEILSTMAYMPAEFDEAYFTSAKFHYGEISGVMTLKGVNEGAIIVTMSSNLAKKIISSMMAIPVEKVDENIESDGIGELLNMIAGSTKTKLSYSDAHFSLTTPSVLRRYNHNEIPSFDMPNVVMVYKIDDEYLAVKVCMAGLDKS